MNYSQRIVAVLTPLLGPDRVRAQVAAEIDTATTEEAREQYRPDSQVVRSEQTSEDISRTGAGPQGVPGALTNQPPQGGTALPPGVKPDRQCAGRRGRQPTRPTVRSSPPATTRSTAPWPTRSTPAGRLAAAVGGGGHR